MYIRPSAVSSRLDSVQGKQAFTPRKSGAFTLIELLIVLVIIGVLAAILFPVLARSQEKSRQAPCLSNLRQMSAAWLMYTQDFDQTTIPWTVSGHSNSDAFAWDRLVQHYQKSDETLRCPSAGAAPVTYSYNACVGGATCGHPSDPLPAPPPRMLSSLQNTAQTPMIAECKGIEALPDQNDKIAGWSFSFICPDDKRGIQARGLRYVSMDDKGYPTGWQRWNEGRGFNVNLNQAGTILPNRHQEGSNYVFADGHAEWVRSEKAADGSPIPPKSGMDYDSDGTLGNDSKAGTQNVYD